MTDDLSPDMRSLFDAERRRDADEIPAGAKDRVHAAIAASIGVGFGTAAGTGAAAKTAALAKGSGAAAAAKLAAASGAAATVAPAATATGGILAKGLAVALVAAMAGTAGTGIYLANRDDAKKTPPAPVVTHVVDPAPTFDPHALLPPAPAPAPAPVVTPHVAAAPHVEATPPKKVETPEEKATRLAGERTVLDAARSAIARGDGGQALVALEAHRDQYPDGALVEEREALTVLALAKLGRVDDAKEKAARFKAKYPSSLFAGAVDDAIKN